jgi:predicted nucleotidyltransferase
MKDLIIVADGLVWMDRYDDNYNEVPDYQYIFSNFGITMVLLSLYFFKDRCIRFASDTR